MHPSHTSVNEAFWRDPPWRGAGAKHRMGLTPVARSPLTRLADGEVLHNKRTQLDHNYSNVVASVPDSADAQRLLHQLPECADARMNYPDPVANCALCVVEDLCLIDVHNGNQLVAACVCAPSYWRLLDKIGLPLTEIHAPVEGMNAKIGANVERFFCNLPLATTFVRQNWFLHGAADLYQPATEDLFSFPVDNWVMRCEYQSLYKLTARYVLFGIRVVCEPLLHITHFPTARRDLAAAVQRMDVHEVAHFGGQRKVDALLHRLAELEH